LPHPVTIRADIRQADTVKNFVKFMDGTPSFLLILTENVRERNLRDNSPDLPGGRYLRS